MDGQTGRHTALILFALVVAPVVGVTGESASGPQGPPAAAGAEAAPAPSLAAILMGVDELEAADRSSRSLPVDEERLRTLSAEIEGLGQSLSDTRRQADSVTKDLMGFHELLDLGVALREVDERLAAASDELASTAKALDAGLDRVTAAGATTAVWMQTAEKRNAPPALRERIAALIPRQEALARELVARRDQVLEVLGRATQLQGTARTVRLEASAHRDQIAAGLRSERSETIWRVGLDRGEWSRARRFLDVQVGRSLGHVRDHGAQLLAIALSAFALAYWLIAVTRDRLAALAHSDPHARRACNLFQRPVAAALGAALGAVLALGPPGPVSYTLTLWALLSLPGVLLARLVVGPAPSLSLYALAGVEISQDLLGALVDPLPLAKRFLLIAMCGGLAIALALDFRRGRLGQAFPALPARLVRWLAAGLVALLAVAVLATVSGHLGAARTLRNLVLGGLSLWLVLAVGAGLLYGLALALMHTWAGRSLQTVRVHGDALRKGLRTGLSVAMAVAWVSGVLVMLGRWDETVRTADSAYRAEIAIGSTRLALHGVWVGLAVILGTLVVAKILTPVLELDVLPRLTRKRGLPFAVAAVTRYVLLAAGTVLAMAAMGIDLTKVSLLAGALGVGIGFGLQGVVNNFVSGLILLMERPVSVGDVVQIGSSRGMIRRIGVRSSTVQTFEGAEVIVPNADLISKEVTNWTLSDRRRRLEIDVGVAYGTEPGVVVTLLQAAAGTVAEVLAAPPPLAWCTGFGDSSIDFRLEAWVDDYDRGKANQSALRIAIVKAFKDASIEIPFPQRDIHIRTTAAALDSRREADVNGHRAGPAKEVS